MPGPYGDLVQSWGRVATRDGIPFQPWTVMGKPHYSCPLLKVPDYWPRVWSYYLGWEKGILPDPGGMRDQPAWFSRLMGFIQSRLDEFRKERMDRERKR